MSTSLLIQDVSYPSNTIQKTKKHQLSLNPISTIKNIHVVSKCYLI